MKHSIMIFIPKADTSQTKPENPRPISLLNVEGKLFDKILKNRFMNQIELRGLNDDRQHGFRRNRGTNTALATIYETIANKMNQQCLVDIVLRDVSKAFDKVWHKGLQFKILNLGLHTCFTRILTSFLSNRTASIRIDQHIGTPFALKSGVPQGACLSPSLYTFYIHDIGEPPANTDYSAYADDITQIIATLGLRARGRVSLHSKKAIEHINHFEKKWKIKTNPTKFSLINLLRKKTASVCVDNTTYEYTKQGKVLGLQVNSHGICPQAAVRKHAARANLAKLYRFKNLSENNKRKLYLSTVQSTLIYPTVPFNTISKSQMLQLQAVQNQGLKFITNTSWDEYRTAQSLHEQCNIDPINVIIHNQAAKTWQKMEDFLPGIYHKLVDDTPEIRRLAQRFPSSRLKAEGPPPHPLYAHQRPIRDVLIDEDDLTDDEEDLL